MPWEQTSAMDQRVKFIADWLSGDYLNTALCTAYGISRPTADTWITRDQHGGVKALEEYSRAPHTHPNETAEHIREVLVKTKLSHQHWGPKKVVDHAREQDPTWDWPADSTVGAMLKRAGLVKCRVLRQRVAPYSAPLSACQGPNQIWSTDFKGDFLLGNGRRCYPLTLSDHFSRDLLICRALPRPNDQAVQPWFEWAFREYGLPQAIRSDHGAPFASMAVGGLSALSKWWLTLGIRPERIKPGQPSQNGRHERMHRTLKHAVPPQPTLPSQQRHFDRFLHEYNWQRSHEALARNTPGSVYGVSTRRYPAKLPAVEYDSGVIVRHVRQNGEIKWHGELIDISQVLAHEPVGLTQVSNEQWEVQYSFHQLGILDGRTKKILPVKNWHGS